MRNTPVTAIKDTYDETGESTKPVEQLEAKLTEHHELGDVLEIVLTPQEGDDMQTIFITLDDLVRAIEARKKS